MVTELSAVPNLGTLPAGASQPATDNEFRLFGKDGFTFWDFLDIINPLQHIPVVSTIYRAVTGDEIDPGSRIGGGTLFAGPIGAAVSVANVVIERGTGKDIGEHMLALIDSSDLPVPTERPPAQNAILSNRAATNLSATTTNIVDPPPTHVPFSARSANTEAAGMSAIPIARQDTTANYFKRAPVPDLELLATTGATPTVSTAPTTRMSTAPRISPAEEPPHNKTLASQIAYRGINQVSKANKELRSSWVYDAMMRGLDKYERSARLGESPPTRGVSVVR